ncbi:MAG: TonB-dependent receptor [Saprospiraceae bacterium]
MINNKFGVSMLLTHWQGDGWAEGTKGQGQNYFLSFGYKPNAKNTVNFLITGAPQWHDQNYTKKLSSYYNSDGELNVKYNSNWGYVDGEYLSERRNYYHKPVANLNWDWYINEKSKLSTVLYASWGVGGGTGGYGAYAKTTTDGYKDWDATIAYNESITDGIGSNNTNGSGYVGTAIRGSRNNHSWYGLVTKYDSKLTQHLSYSVGADLRTYKGKHFRELTNLLGLSGFDESDNARYGSNHIVTETYYASPWKSMFNSASLDQQIDYSYSERISYEGLFGQLEYVMNNFSTFVQGSVSSQQHQRFEFWNETEANEASEKVTNPGFNVKGGASYTVNEQHTFFGNIGYYHRQPVHDDVYLNYSNLVNPVTVPEKIFGAELGYKFVSEKFALNFNAYRTEWNDRSTTTFLSDGTELSNGYVIVGEGYKNAIQDELHSGLEWISVMMYYQI